MTIQELIDALNAVPPHLRHGRVTMRMGRVTRSIMRVELDPSPLPGGGQAAVTLVHVLDVHASLRPGRSLAPSRS